MWINSLKRRASEPKKSREFLPAGVRIYAIGDIHGSLDLLDRLADKIALDLNSAAPVERTLAVFLGDYIDRGPKSSGVLAKLAAKQFPIPFVALRGNHEEMLIAFLNDASYMASWRHFGGLETLHSFGIDVRAMREPADFERARGELVSALTESQIQYLDTTKTCYSEGDVFFCHAGIRPGIPLERQSPQDLLWIRDEFISSPIDHGKLIVHGHTPVEQPDVRANRINIDTGAYLAGTLTALVLEGASMRFLAT